jgi:hypothetical protein
LQHSTTGAQSHPLLAGAIASIFVGSILQALISQEIDDIDSNDFCTLQISGRGSEVDLYVNGVCVHRIPDATLLYGDPGVFALSIGKYTFDDFAIYQRKI